ncbi:ribonuclease P protein component [Bryobacter aggregatus]|uniref:ribonuclease P protein component n=1 Tax=Bryobacter aggregatus TaxID=360054 RepID=UPI0009B5D28B
MPDYPKSVRLLRPSEFRQTYDGGVKHSCPIFACFYRKTDTSAPARFGFTCPRALGKAVVRNRIKRRLRECVRLKRERFPLGMDLVFNPRKALLDAPWSEVERHVEKLLLRLEQQCVPSSSPS